MISYSAYAENENTAVTDETGSNDRKIVMLPFHNYSQSELKYLSTYIPVYLNLLHQAFRNTAES